MEAVEEWKQLHESFSTGFSSLTRASEKERTLKRFLPKMGVVPISGSKLHHQYEFFYLLFFEDLEDYKLNLAKIEEEEESKFESLERECDHTFKMAYEMFLAAAQDEQANSHMDGHLKDFVMAIRR
ncbi:hypothetical protein NL676_021552 [Syzygium grande]|nr:hypothetical protein NL676_021552 [Syzygium grande]